MNKLMRKPGEDPIMTPAQLEALESDLRERAKPLGDRHWIDGTQRLASDLADVVAHLRTAEQDAEQGFHDAQQAANVGSVGMPEATLMVTSARLQTAYEEAEHLREEIKDLTALINQLRESIKRCSGSCGFNDEDPPATMCTRCGAPYASQGQFAKTGRMSGRTR